MNENFNYSDNGYREPDYYDLYGMEKKKEARRVFSRYALALFLYTLVATAVSLIIQVIMIAVLGVDKAGTLLEESVYLNWILGVLPMYLIGFPIFYLIIKDMPKNTRERKSVKPSMFLKLFLVAQAGITVGSLIGNSLNASISALLGREIQNSTSELIEKSPIWLIFLVTVIIAPIIEELLFRKFMIDRISRYGDTVAIIVSAVAFGLFHGNFYQFFYAALIGLLLGYMYCRTGNVKHTILMHMIINFLGSVAVMPVMELSEDFITMSEAMANGEIIDMAAFMRAAMAVMSYSIIQYALAAVGIVILVLAIRDRKIKVKKYGEFTIPRGEVFKTVVLNTGAILFLVFSAFTFVANIFMV